MIRFECDCGARLKVNDDQQGNEFDCPKCGERVTVPVVLEPPEPIDEPAPVPPPLPQRTSSVGNAATEPVGIDHASKKGRGYVACRRLQLVLKWLGFLCIVSAILGVVTVAGGGGDAVIIPGVITIVSSIAGFFIYFALAELLGGTIAFLVKNDCYP